MSGLIHVSDPRDPRVEPYLNIRDRDLVGGRGVFIAEGSVVLRRLLASKNYAPISALVLANRLPGLTDVAEQMSDRGIPIYVANREIIDAIAGFPMHRGVLAIGSANHPETVDSILAGLPPQATIIVCVGIANHDNIGAIFRNAAGLGADAVVYDTSSCDPFYRKAIRVSVGSMFDMPNARFESSSELRDKLAAAGFQQIAMSPSGKTELRNLKRGQRTALYLGAEGSGLPDELHGQLEAVRIDMTPGFDSLNVAAASAVALYALRIQGAETGN